MPEKAWYSPRFAFNHAYLGFDPDLGQEIDLYEYTDLVIMNTYNFDLEVPVTVRNPDGTEYAEIYAVIPGNGLWIGSEQRDWIFLNSGTTMPQGSITVPSSDSVIRQYPGYATTDGEILVMQRTRVNLANQVSQGTPFNQHDPHFIDDSFLFPGELSTSLLYAPLYVKEWNDFQEDVGQWNELLVHNPNGTLPIQLNATIYGVSGSYAGSGQKGEVLGTFTDTIQPYATLSTIGNPEWEQIRGVADQQRGWIEIRTSSTYPGIVPDDWEDVVGISRTIFTQGKNRPYGAGGGIIRMDDEVLVSNRDLSSVKYLPMYIRDVQDFGGNRQWSNAVIINSSDTDYNLIVDLYRGNGEKSLAPFTKLIGSKNFWNSLGDSDWNQVGSGNPITVGWAKFTTHDNTNTGMIRWRSQLPGGETQPIEYFDDDADLLMTPYNISGVACDKADFNDDKVLDQTDIDAAVACLFRAECDPNEDYDINEDGRVSENDVVYPVVGDISITAWCAGVFGQPGQMPAPASN